MNSIHRAPRVTAARRDRGYNARFTVGVIDWPFPIPYTYTLHATAVAHSGYSYNAFDKQSRHAHRTRGRERFSRVCSQTLSSES